MPVQCQFKEPSQLHGGEGVGNAEALNQLGAASMFVLPSLSPGNRKAYVFVHVQFSDKLGNVISM